MAAALLLRATQQARRGRPHRLVPAVEQFRPPAVRGAHGQGAFGRDVDGEAIQPVEERVGRRGRVQQRLALLAQLGHLLGVDGDEQVAARGEMAIEGGVAYPRAPCDVVQRHVGSLLVEELPRRRDQRLGVSCCIRSACHELAPGL
jgi:hypothetical protein